MGLLELIKAYGDLAEAISKNGKICPVCNAEANLLNSISEVFLGFQWLKTSGLYSGLYSSVCSIAHTERVCVCVYM